MSGTPPHAHCESWLLLGWRVSHDRLGGQLGERPAGQLLHVLGADADPEGSAAVDEASRYSALGPGAWRRDGEIGESLFISKKTVSVHVSNVLRKLAVGSRVEAGKIGQAHGLGAASVH